MKDSHLQSPIPATAPVNTYLDVNPAGAGPVFYRILVW